MTLWEFSHCYDGWQDANTREEDRRPPPMSEDELRDLKIEGI